MASTPDSIKCLIPSGKGKKASEATTDPLILSGTNSRAFPTAILQLLNLLGCPDPIPIVEISFAKTIALDFTNLQTLKANFKFLICSIEGFLCVTILIFFANNTLSESCAKNLFPKKR